MGWLPKSRLLGVSGAVIQPDVHLALDISGQVKHMSASTERPRSSRSNKGQQRHDLPPLRPGSSRRPLGGTAHAGRTTGLTVLGRRSRSPSAAHADSIRHGALALPRSAAITNRLLGWTAPISPVSFWISVVDRSCQTLCSGEFPLGVGSASRARLQLARVPQSLRCPSQVVLPREEEITGGSEISFVVAPDLFGDLDHLGAPTELIECFHHPVH